MRKGPRVEVTCMDLCRGRWVGACYRIKKQPYNLSTLVKRTLTLVKSMEDLRLIKSGATATAFSGL